MEEGIYYEEKVENGKLFRRLGSEGKWIAMEYEDLLCLYASLKAEYQNFVNEVSGKLDEMLARYP